ncbi:Na(+)/H(+) exchange regulatory cofactor NHE-RF1a isoform X2 [Esox lucius]|uniref:Na(+)/H(+) exchange regulatory cofactor NHE-RF n=1 Tax=Esox lucius TaxID=8010 RepID=A0A3P8Z674_ESOLU|nr:Na(+)/H(+) exchange regulatory cofactor NHE-RF1a isoform X2 [Esox lucius]
MSNLRPRRCLIEKGSNGYGFHLHGEKGKTGQFIRLVEPDSPAATAGLFAGDQLSFVNGVFVAGESHQQVVARIRATVGSLELIVVDAETADLLKKNNLECREEYVTEGIPLTGSDSDHGKEAENNSGSRQSTPTPGENENISLQSLSLKDSKAELRPRLCLVKKGATGFGFNLHSEKSKPGQYIRAVDQDSPAEKAGLKPKDKIIQVNSMSVIDMQHGEVVAAIKAGGDETSLLVVDPETDAFFNSCNVTPTEAHLTGPLPEPVSNGGAQEQLDKTTATLKPKESIRASTSSSSSTDSLLPAAASTRPPETDLAPAEESEAGLSLSMSLAQAKEKARQKRAAKKAPAMDWSKRNELFSNL